MHASTTTRAPISQAGHVGLNVTNLARSTAFYRDVLGLDVMLESKEPKREYAFLGHDGRIVLTLWQQSGRGFDPERAGLHHLSFEVDGIQRVQEAQRALKALGVEIRYEGIVPHAEGLDSGGIFFDDPDGARLEIYAKTGAGSHAAPTPGAPTCGFF